jgi:uncharacterized protein YpmS
MEWFLVKMYPVSSQRWNLPLTRRLLLLIIPLTIFAMVSLACSVSLGGPTAPADIVMTDENPTDLSQAWSHAYTQRQSGQWIVVFSESQLTAYMQARLASEHSIPLYQPQVFLRDGKISLYGQYQTEYLTASVLIKFQPTIREDGTVEWDVVDGQFGPAHLPAGLLSVLSDMVNQALASPTGAIATGFQIKEVLIGDGRIAIRCQSTS